MVRFVWNRINPYILKIHNARSAHMKTKVLTALCMVLLTSKVHAQTDTIVRGERKNEVGLAIGPMALIMLGGQPYPQPIGIGYKRVYGAWAIRFSAGMVSDNNSFMLANYTEKQVIDSIETWRNEYRTSRSYFGRLGMERRWNLKGNCKFVIGADLQARHVETIRVYDQMSSKIDSVWYGQTAQPYSYTSGSTQARLLDEKTIGKQLGLGLSFGFLVPLGKRWWLSTQYRGDFFIGPQKTRIKDHVEGSDKTYTSMVSDLNIGPIISELALYYRF
jgi:hypothetical protein